MSYLFVLFFVFFLKIILKKRAFIQKELFLCTAITKTSILSEMTTEAIFTRHNQLIKQILLPVNQETDQAPRKTNDKTRTKKGNTEYKAFRRASKIQTRLNHKQDQPR